MTDNRTLPVTRALQPSREGRIGVELEFAGITEAEAAETLSKATGGTARQTGARSWEVETDLFGTCDIYIDTTFDEAVARVAGSPGIEALRSVVPVELVTEPFEIRHLPELDRVVGCLRDAGAQGTRDGLFLGFGTHLNIEADAEDATSVARHLAAYALLEEYLRQRNPIDLSRRVLPFVAPYPDKMVDALAEGVPDFDGSMDGLIAFYLDHAPSRDHGLDLLPLLATQDEDRVRNAAEGLSEIKARPAYHFRLPDCRIDEADWSILQAWDDWCLVQTVALDATLLERLRAARRDWSAGHAWGRPPWFKAVETILGTSGEAS